MSKKLFEPTFNGQTPNVGGPRASPELTDNELNNFAKKSRGIKTSDRKKRGEAMPNATDHAAELDKRRRQKQNAEYVKSAIRSMRLP